MLKLNTKIYYKKAILQGIDDFSEIAEIKVNFKNGYAVLEPKKLIHQDKVKILDELGNYILGLTKKCL